MPKPKLHPKAFAVALATVLNLQTVVLPWLPADRAVAFDGHQTSQQGLYTILLRYYKSDQEAKNLSAKISQDPHSAPSRAFFLMRECRYQQAIALLNKTIESNPKSADAHAWRAMCYERLHYYNHALADYLKAIDVAPHSRSFCFYIVPVLEKLGRYEDALHYCDQAIALDPTYGYGYACKGYCYQLMKKDAEAADLYKKAESLGSNVAAVHIQIAQSLTTAVNMKRDAVMAAAASHDAKAEEKAAELPVDASRSENNGWLQKALHEIDEANKLDPSDPSISKSRASILFSMDKVEEAIEEMRRSIKLRPLDSDLHASFAWYLHEARKDTQAMSEAKEAVRLNPQSAGAHDTLAMFLRSQGSYHEAHQEVQEKKRLDAEQRRFDSEDKGQ